MFRDGAAFAPSALNSFHALPVLVFRLRTRRAAYLVGCVSSLLLPLCRPRAVALVWPLQHWHPLPGGLSGSSSAFTQEPGEASREKKRQRLEPVCIRAERKNFNQVP